MCDIEEIVKKCFKDGINVELEDFIPIIKDYAYPDSNFDFMEYFLSLTKQKTFHKFIVHQSQLIKYGIALSDTKQNIKKRLTSLGLLEGKHYKEIKVKKNLSGENGGNSIGRTIYKLTPYAFKLCLIRARKINADQKIDPIVYSEYYMFIESCVAYYLDYRKMVLDAENEKKEKLLKEKEKLLTEKTNY